MSPSACPPAHRLARLAAGAALLVLVTASTSAAATWSRTYGGASTNEAPQALAELADGTIVVAAVSDSFGTLTGDGWLLRVDPDGNLVSESSVGDPLPGGVDGAVVMPDGGAVFGGRRVIDIFFPHDGWVARVDAAGALQWSFSVSDPMGRFFANDFALTRDGGIVAAGEASLTDAPPHEIWIVKMDDAGNVAWQQYWGGVIGTVDSIHSVIETSDFGFAMVGTTTAGSGGGEDLYLVKTNELGAISWAKAIGGTEREQGTGIVQLADDSLVVCGFTDSFTGSGHAGWVMRFDAFGTLIWQAVLGDSEWSDLYGLTATSDGEIVVIGRIAEGGFPTNDLWALKLAADDGTILWQRAYEGDSGDFGYEVLELSGGDLLLAATWAWGFAEEDLWLLRTDSEGRIADCPAVRDTAVRATEPMLTESPVFAPPFPPFGTVGDAMVTAGTAASDSVTRCAAAGCAPLLCNGVTVDPAELCEGESVTLSLDVSGGEAPVEVAWDLDGDTVPDLMGNPVEATPPAGLALISATATDSCPAGAQSCEETVEVSVLPSDPPAEVSDAAAGAPPLLVLDHGDRILFEELAGAAAFNVHADAIGSWYAPTPANGSACFVATTPAGPGTLEAAMTWPAGSWLVVTASTSCAEGPAGRDSRGAERGDSGTWDWCGAAP